VGRRFAAVDIPYRPLKNLRWCERQYRLFAWLQVLDLRAIAPVIMAALFRPAGVEGDLLLREVIITRHIQHHSRVRCDAVHDKPSLIVGGDRRDPRRGKVGHAVIRHALAVGSVLARLDQRGNRDAHAGCRLPFQVDKLYAEWHFRLQLEFGSRFRGVEIDLAPGDCRAILPGD
jgi:hypothetical protein